MATLTAVPQGHNFRVTTLGKSRGPLQNFAEPRGNLGDPRRGLLRTPLRGEDFLGEPHGRLCSSDGDPLELSNCYATKSRGLP